jgi:hypothetical protein
MNHIEKIVKNRRYAPEFESRVLSTFKDLLTSTEPAQLCIETAQVFFAFATLDNGDSGELESVFREFERRRQRVPRVQSRTGSKLKSEFRKTPGPKDESTPGDAFESKDGTESGSKTATTRTEFPTRPLSDVQNTDPVMDVFGLGVVEQIDLPDPKDIDALLTPFETTLIMTRAKKFAVMDYLKKHFPPTEFITVFKDGIIQIKDVVVPSCCELLNYIKTNFARGKTRVEVLTRYESVLVSYSTRLQVDYEMRVREVDDRLTSFEFIKRSTDFIELPTEARLNFLIQNKSRVVFRGLNPEELKPLKNKLYGHSFRVLRHSIYDRTRTITFKRSNTVRRIQDTVETEDDDRIADNTNTVETGEDCSGDNIDTVETGEDDDGEQYCS